MLKLTMATPAPDWVLLGPITLQQRQRPAGPRLTDSGLFAQLNLNYPGLEAVRAAVADGNIEQARTALATHFRTRQLPHTIYPHPGAEHALSSHVRTRTQPQAVNRPAAESATIANAEQLMQHVILGEPLGPEIDWRANPIGYLEWMHAFNRHYWMQHLIKAYLTTGDERYAAELAALVSSWLKATPPPVGNNGGGDPSWETLSTAVRCYGAWFDIFYACLHSPHFTDTLLVDMVKSFYEHAEHLMEFSVTRHNNWLVVESQVIASIGVLFPEYTRAAEWRREGYARLTAEIATQVYPDGVQWELSAGYHALRVEYFENTGGAGLVLSWAGPGIAKQVVPASNLVQMGIGGWYGSRPGMKVARDRQSTVITISDVEELGIEKAVEVALECAWKDADAVFLSFDIDSIDAGFVPGTGSPEPGGMLPREALKALRMIAREGICGMEVVEIAPPYDVSDMTAQLGCRAIMDVLGTLVEEGYLGSRRPAEPEREQIRLS